MQLNVSVEIQRLNVAIAAYAQLRARSMLEIIQQKSAFLAFQLNERLKLIKPAKGSIRAAQLARFKGGGGIRVSDWIKKRVSVNLNLRTSLANRLVVGTVKASKGIGKHLIFGEGVWQKMVEMEINSRESGSGFLSLSALYPRGGLKGGEKSKSRFGGTLSTFGLRASEAGATGTFTWDGSVGVQAEGAAAGLTKEPKAQSAIAEAVAATTEDILLYVNRKTGENITRAGLA